MPRPASGNRSDPRPGLPVVDRLAPPPPASSVAAIIEAATAPGDVVVDCTGRGGWIGRAAHARRRKAISLETSPLTRLAAEVVLRPPDLRHLDATVAAIAAQPVGGTSLRLAVADYFRTRCRRCGRRVVAEEVVWQSTGETPEAAGAEPPAPDEPAAAHPWQRARPIEVRYRCPACGSGVAGRETAAPVDDDDAALARGAALQEAAAARRRLLARFGVGANRPVPSVEPSGSLPDEAVGSVKLPADGLPAELLDLHSPRQLATLAAILDAIDGGLRAPSIDAALRFALLAAVGQASRLLGPGGRVAPLRVAGGRLRVPADSWRERNPWLAFEAGVRLVRGLVQQLEAEDPGLGPARFGEDLRALLDGPATVVVRLATPDALATLADEAAADGRSGRAAPIRLAVLQAPPSPSPERLLAAYQASGWVLGTEDSARIPIAALAAGTAGAAVAGSPDWGLVALRRTLEGAAAILSPGGRAVVLVPGLDREALASVAVAASRAGYRLMAARPAPEPDRAWIVELDPPRSGADGGPYLGGAVGGGSAAAAPNPDPEGRPLSIEDVRRTVVDAAITTLKALGEPADAGRLVGPLLVALDRAGHLRRAGGAADRAPEPDPAGEAGAPAARPDHRPSPLASDPVPGPEPTPSSGAGSPARSGSPIPAARTVRLRPGAPGRRAVDAVVEVLDAVLAGAERRRLVSVGDELWLADREDRAAAAEPLADRIEWAVLTLLATAGPIEPDRVVAAVEARLGLDHPNDRALVRACLDNYAVPTSDGRLVAREAIVARTHEHTRILARIAELGRQLGFSVWLPPRERSRRLGGVRLDAYLSDRERRVDLAGLLGVPADALDGLDAVWYVRGRATFYVEVEWTAMLGTPILRRGPRLPTDERTVRFLVLAPERRELARRRLDRSAVLRATVEADNWHVLLWNQLERFAALEAPSLAALEPFLGLDPPVERRAGDQLAFFEPGPSSPESG